MSILYDPKRPRVQASGAPGQCRTDEGWFAFCKRSITGPGARRARAWLALLLMLWLPSLHATSVFILHAYSQEYDWTRRQHAGFVTELQNLHAQDVQFMTEYLDTKRRPLDENYAREMTRHLRAKYASVRPDLVYVTDDDGLQFARRWLTQIFPDVPVIFSGVNDYRVLDTLDTTLVTGVFEKKEIAPNMRILRNFGLANGDVGFVGDDSGTYQAIKREIEDELAQFPELRSHFFSAPTIEGLVESLRSCVCRYVFLTTVGGLRNEAGAGLSLREIITAIAAAGDYVLFSMEDGYLFDGVLGGYVTSGTRQGRAAAAMAAAVLSGASVAALPPLLDSPNEYIFDERELLKARIRLPEEVGRSATLLNAQLSFYESNRKLVLASLVVLGFALFVVLIVSVALLTVRKRQLQQVAEALTVQRDALEQTQESLQTAQRIAALGSWRLDLKTGQLTWSDGIYRIFELDKTGCAVSYQAFLDAVHPDDRELVNKAYKDSVRNRTGYEVEHRLLMPDGRIKHVQERGTTSFDALGEPVVSVGTVQDITERKQAEQRLHQWAAIFENTIEAVIITDTDQRIVDVNRAFEQITGFSKQEAIGKRPNFRRSDRHDKAFYQRMWSSIDAQGSWTGEIWNRNRSGEPSPEWLSISSIYGSNGELVNYVGVFTDISALKRSEEKLEHLANHDPLTGLANRLLLNDRLDRAIRRMQRDSKRLAVLFLDLDRFKIVNDTLGHAVGDELLQQVAARLQACLRSSDTIGRLGGDEFLVIIEDYRDQSEIERLAEKLHKSLVAVFPVNTKELFIGVSIGISLFPEDGSDASTLIRNADSALYRAKEAGRGSYSFYHAELTRQAEARLEIEAQLRGALQRGEFRLNYQPKIDLRTGRVVAAEALIRWHRSDGSVTPPDAFIPVAEETGLILPVGEWVIAEAGRQLAEWRDAGYPLDHIAINISAVQIQRGALVDNIRQLLEHTRLQPGMLELEITESVLLDSPEKALEVLGALRELGVSVALDDFGTGFSSLSNLKQYPITTLKVDRSFVKDILHDPSDAAITRAVVAMGRSLDITVVAEGVETLQHAELLLALGCDQAQGYYYGRPVPAEQFPGMVAVIDGIARQGAIS